MQTRWTHCLNFTAIGFAMALAQTAHAGGFEFPDHGAAAMSRGGAAVAATEGVTALYYNPAGLADLEGLQVLIDGEFALLSSRFQRTVEDVDGNRVNLGDAVGNSRNPLIAPFVGVSYQIIDKLTVAAGLYGPSSFAWQRYPDPRLLQPTAWDGDFGNDPTDFGATTNGAPQRYNLIDSTIIVAYPSIALAYRPVKYVSIGATAQVVMGSTAFSQAIYAGFAQGEDPASDAIASLSVKAKPSFTGIIGLQIHPIENLSLGVSFRPGGSQTSEGSLKLTFSDSLTGLATTLGQDLEQTKDAASFINDYPSIARFGVAYAGEGWLCELGGTYEGWSRVQSFTVKTDGVEVFMGDALIDVPDIIIPKKWKDTFSLRLGGRFELGKLLGKDLPLTLRTGYIHETGAVPESTLALDFISGARNQVTLGASYDLGPVTLSVAATRVFQAAMTVTDSEVLQTASPPPGFKAYEGTVVGNGRYEASTTLFIVGLEGHFLANN